MPNPSTARIIETHKAVQEAYRELMKIYDRVLPQLTGEERASLGDVKLLALVLDVRGTKLMAAADRAADAAAAFCVGAEKALYPSKEVGDE